MQVVVNGRFLDRTLTGVDRVAEEVLKALHQLVAEKADDVRNCEFAILASPGRLRSLELGSIPEQVVGTRRGHAWEQFDLARSVKGRFLVNFCNTAPISIGRSMTVIHDAQVYQAPESYSRAFRTAYKVLLPVLGRRAAAIATVSDFSKQELERFRVVPAGKAVVIPNGSDHIDRVEPDPLVLERHGLTEKPYVLAIGSLSPHKNLQTLLTANRMRATRETVPLVIAGGHNATVFADAKLDADPSVIFAGRVSDGELKALYGKAEALLFPSLFEGFGLPPLEAMRCGCPVVASTADAVRETCGDAALYADPRDPQAWAREIDRIVSDPELRADLKERGHRRAATYTWRRTALDVVKLIRTAHRS